MLNDNRIPDGIINPFSEAFLDTWQLWKDYRWEQHKFKYKGCISEQTRLITLAKMSDGNEDVAIRIIMQSIENGWSGFYELKTIKIKANGTEHRANHNETRESLNDLNNQRFGRGR